MATTEEQVNVPFFKKKGKGRPSTSRKRSPSPAGNESSRPGLAASSTTKSEVVLPTRKGTTNLLAAGTKRTLSQREGIVDLDEHEKDGPDVKWTAAGSHTNAALEILAGDEAEELLAKRRRKERADVGEEEEILDDGKYHGQSGYLSHIKKSTEVPKAMRVGPQRSTSTIRTVTIVDYQPDVCKDYKGVSPLSLICVRQTLMLYVDRNRLLWFW
jgi:RING finger protein 113A